jgi:hypothetical protein
MTVSHDVSNFRKIYELFNYQCLTHLTHLIANVWLMSYQLPFLYFFCGIGLNTKEVWDRIEKCWSFNFGWSLVQGF